MTWPGTSFPPSTTLPSAGSVANWTTATLTYDGLNRVTGKIDRDRALTTYAYNPLGDLTNRTMPGELAMAGDQ